MKRFIYLSFAIFFLHLCHAQIPKNELQEFSKWSINLETGLVPIQSMNTKTIPCYQGQLGLAFNSFSKLEIGIFGQTLFYTGNYELANIDNKIIELSSIEYNTLGISTGYKMNFQKWVIIPKLDIGYNLFIAKSLDFPTDKTSFLDYRYLSITPKANFGYFLSDGFMLGLNIGYNRQITALKGKILSEFDPNSILLGLVTKIKIK